MRLALILALSQSHVERLGHQDTTVHFSHGLGRLLRWTETDEAKALRPTTLVHHLWTHTQTTVSKQVRCQFTYHIIDRDQPALLCRAHISTQRNKNVLTTPENGSDANRQWVPHHQVVRKKDWKSVSKTTGFLECKCYFETIVKTGMQRQTKYWVTLQSRQQNWWLCCVWNLFLIPI